MTKWEYFRIQVSYSDLDKQMNFLGNENWEAFAIIDGPPAHVEIYFKRPVQFLKTQLLNE